MKILLAFAPFLAFALVDRLVGPTAGLIAGAAVSAILLARDAMTQNRKIKVLEVGTAILFGGLAIYSVLGKIDWSIIGVRLCVDIGLLCIVLASIGMRRPFTLQYAREGTPREIWETPQFIRVNYIISAVWAAAFAVMVAADIVMLRLPNVPMRVGIWTTIIALYAAIRFTGWYPNRKA